MPGYGSRSRLVWVVRLVGPRRVEIHEKGRRMRLARPGGDLLAPGILQNPVPVLALYQAYRPFDEEAVGYAIRSDQERAALRQYFAAEQALSRRGQQDLRAAVPTARIVELTFANPFLFLSNEADVLREIRAFAATLTGL